MFLHKWGLMKKLSILFHMKRMVKCYCVMTRQLLVQKPDKPSKVSTVILKSDLKYGLTDRYRRGPDA